MLNLEDAYITIESRPRDFLPIFICQPDRMERRAHMVAARNCLGHLRQHYVNLARNAHRRYMMMARSVVAHRDWKRERVR